MTEDARNDAELTVRAADGSEHAFRTLYRAYVRPVYWVAHRLLANAADAEDVTQETFVVAWRKLPELRLAGDSLLPWLVTICRFQAANRIRGRQRDRQHTTGALETETIPALVNVEQQVIDAETLELILREVRGLSELDQNIFRLCAVSGYGYQAAATALGVSHAVVRNRLSRVRTRLRTSVKEDA